MRNILLPAFLVLTPALALAAEDHPPLVEELGLTGAETVSVGADGRHVTGALPGGQRVELDFNAEGALEDIEAEGDEGFPAEAVAAAVPEAIRANPDYPADALFDELDLDDGGLELEGTRGDGQRFEAEFAADGQLLEMKME